MWQGVLKKAGAAADRQDWPRAEKILLNAASKPGVPPVVWFQLGKVMFVQRKLDDAVEWFAKAAEAAPNIPDGWFELGRALGAADRFEEALPALQRALVLDPNNVQAHRFASFVARKIGDDETADDHGRAFFALGGVDE